MNAVQPKAGKTREVDGRGMTGKLEANVSERSKYRDYETNEHRRDGSGLLAGSEYT